MEGMLAARARRAGLRPVAVMVFAVWTTAGFGQTHPPVSVPQGQDPGPSADRILELALERAERNDDAGVELAFESFVESSVETLGRDGAMVEVASTRMRRYPLEGEMYEEFVARDGRDLNAAEARKEAKRRAAFIRAARRRSARGEERDPKERRMRFDRKLMGRYRTVLSGTEEIRGHPCWVLGFAPRSGRLPSDGAMDRALNQSTGTLWILKSNYELARIVFEMQTPVRYMWGLFATLKQVDGRIDFEAVGPGLWLPSRFRLELDVSVLAGVKSFRRRIGMRWVNYRPAAASADSASGSR